MRRILFLLILLIVAVFSCADRQPAGPEDNVVTFARYDAESHFEGTASAWYCSTSADFEYALINHTDGDIIYLANDDTLFYATITTVNASSDDNIHGSIIGLGAGKSKVKIKTFTQDQWFDVGLQISPMALEDTSYVTNVEVHTDISTPFSTFTGWNKENFVVFENVDAVWSHDFNHFWFGGDGGGKIIDADTVRFSQTAGGDVHTYGVSWYDAENVCDISSVGYFDPVQHSWIYDDTLYSYDDFAFDDCFGGLDQGVWWDTDEDSVTVAIISNQYNCTGELIYGSGSCATTVDMRDVNFGPGQPCEGTYLWIKVGVGALQQRFYWRVRSTLCDKSIITSCTMKSRPRLPENGPPDPTE